MNSATSSNGFLFVSSEANNTENFDGTPISTTATNVTPINLSGFNNVILRFEHQYRWWQETRGVRVSGDNGATWTEYLLTLSVEDLLDNGEECINCGGSTYPPDLQSSLTPKIEMINISDVAGGQSQVLIQFYYNDFDYWGWYWAVDDVSILAQQQYDASLENIIWGWDNSFDELSLPYFQIPISQLAPIDFSSRVDNYGSDNINTTFTATVPGIFSGASNPVNLTPFNIDTLTVLNSFTPPSVPGSYDVQFNLNTIGSDADLSNNTTDNYTFEVNENIYARDDGTMTGYISTDTYSTLGNTFQIYATDTLYAIDVVIHPSSPVGSELVGELRYQTDYSGSTVGLVEVTEPHIIHSSDLGNTVTLTFTTPIELEPDTLYKVSAKSSGNIYIGLANAAPRYTSWADNYYSTRTLMVRMNFNPDCAVILNDNSNIINNCFSTGSDGEIIVDPNGGSGNYSYTWIDENGVDLGNSETIENLSNGLYSLILNDNFNCVNMNATFQYEIKYKPLTFQEYEIFDSSFDQFTQPASSATGVNMTCAELSDGQIYFDFYHVPDSTYFVTMGWVFYSEDPPEPSYPPYTITLNNGDEATLTSGSGTAFSLSQGTYTYQVTDGNGCVYNGPSAVDVGVNDMNFGIDLQANPSAGQSPLLVIFDNNTPNAAAYNFTWYFGDGTSELNNAGFVSHTYAVDGLWDVVIVAEEIATGCTDTLSLDDYIFSTGGVSCTHTATLDQSGSITGCPGNIELSCNTDASFSYQWNINGVPINGATSSTYAPQTNGTYSVTIYQDNCPVNSNSVTVTLSNAITPIISSAGNITSCEGGSVTLDAGAGYSSYAWSTGGTNQTETVTSSGDYTVTVMDASTGCMVTSSPYTVNASFMDPQQVCIVGMDSLSNYNRVVWEKPISDGIDYFNVYKEGNAADVYDLIGSVPYDDTAIFVDENSNTAVQAYRYKVAIVDSCGTESALGTFHKTIHLTINQGVGQTWNLIWNHYEGFGFPSYNIYRGTNPGNMNLLATIASNLNSYTDLNPPGGVGIYYQVEVVNTDGCDPLKANDYGVSRSNIATVEVVHQIELGEETLSVYPNPTRGNVTISASSALTNGYEMYDQQGRVVLSGALKGKHTPISLERLSRGSYTIQVEGNYKPFVIINQ